MSNESYDPELIKEIEAFLRREREVEGEIVLTEEQVELFKESIRRNIDRERDLEAYIEQKALEHDVETKVVLHEHTIESEELTSLARDTISYLLSLRAQTVNDKDVILERSLRGRDELSVVLWGSAVPSFLSAEYIDFESYRPSRVESLPQAPKSLGVIGTTEPYSRLRIGSPAGALTDLQTRSVMEDVIAKFPDAPEHGYLNATSYYFFRGSVGKAVYLPTRLLGERALDPEEDDEQEPSVQTLSDITAGDIALIKIGLLAVRNSIVLKPSVTTELE